mmetsp:Transcript_69297/g.178575  ORF Transcript_69297/g.178575 Transcript_69297/m.178575 type:complete len:210 (-) Transcript_69297:1013-1642(-)
MSCGRREPARKLQLVGWPERRSAGHRRRGGASLLAGWFLPYAIVGQRLGALRLRPCALASLPLRQLLRDVVLHLLVLGVVAKEVFFVRGVARQWTRGVALRGRLAPDSQRHLEDLVSCQPFRRIRRVRDDEVIDLLDPLPLVLRVGQDRFLGRHRVREGLEGQDLLFAVPHDAVDLVGEVERIHVPLRDDALAGVHVECVHHRQRQILL